MSNGLRPKTFIIGEREGMESEGEAHNVIMLPEIKPQSPSSSRL